MLEFTLNPFVSRSHRRSTRRAPVHGAVAIDWARQTMRAGTAANADSVDSHQLGASSTRSTVTSCCKAHPTTGSSSEPLPRRRRATSYSICAPKRSNATQPPGSFCLSRRTGHSALPMVLRTPEQKADLQASWSRPDDELFASGACHVLAAAFLERRDHLGYRAVLIQPAPGFRGRHVVIANAHAIFDYRGWSPRDELLQSYAQAMSRLSPGWSYHLTPIDVPIGWDFCRAQRTATPPSSRTTRCPAPDVPPSLRCATSLWDR